VERTVFTTNILFGMNILSLAGSAVMGLSLTLRHHAGGPTRTRQRRELGREMVAAAGAKPRIANPICVPIAMPDSRTRVLNISV
jgi:hypothetical protein